MAHFFESRRLHLVDVAPPPIEIDGVRTEVLRAFRRTSADIPYRYELPHGETLVNVAGAWYLSRKKRRRFVSVRI